MITLGADEIILNIRKNQYAKNKDNRELGRKIRNLITIGLKGYIVRRNSPSHWSNQTGDKNVGAYGLPKTSAQYELPENRHGDLDAAIRTW